MDDDVKMEFGRKYETQRGKMNLEDDKSTLYDIKKIDYRASSSPTLQQLIDDDRYTRTVTRSIAIEQLRFIQEEAPNCHRQFPDFIKSVRLELKLLQWYNNEVLKRKKRYPRTIWMFYLLCRFVALEFEALGPHPNPEDCDANKLVTFLQTFLSNYFKIDAEIRAKVFIVHIVKSSYQHYHFPKWFMEKLTGLALKGTVIQNELDDLYSRDDDLVFVGDLWFNENLTYYNEIDDIGTDSEDSDASGQEEPGFDRRERETPYRRDRLKQHNRFKNRNRKRLKFFSSKEIIEVDDEDSSDDVIMVKDEFDMSDCDSVKKFDDNSPHRDGSAYKQGRRWGAGNQGNGAIRRSGSNNSFGNQRRKTCVITIEDDEEVTGQCNEGGVGFKDESENLSGTNVINSGDLVQTKAAQLQFNAPFEQIPDISKIMSVSVKVSDQQVTEVNLPPQTSAKEDSIRLDVSKSTDLIMNTIIGENIPSPKLVASEEITIKPSNDKMITSSTDAMDPLNEIAAELFGTNKMLPLKTNNISDKPTSSEASNTLNVKSVELIKLSTSNFNTSKSVKEINSEKTITSTSSKMEKEVAESTTQYVSKSFMEELSGAKDTRQQPKVDELRNPRLDDLLEQLSVLEPVPPKSQFSQIFKDVASDGEAIVSTARPKSNDATKDALSENILAEIDFPTTEPKSKEVVKDNAVQETKLSPKKDISAENLKSNEAVEEVEAQENILPAQIAVLKPEHKYNPETAQESILSPKIATSSVELQSNKALEKDGAQEILPEIVVFEAKSNELQEEPEIVSMNMDKSKSLIVEEPIEDRSQGETFSLEEKTSEDSLNKTKSMAVSTIVVGDDKSQDSILPGEAIPIYQSMERMAEVPDSSDTTELTRTLSSMVVSSCEEMSKDQPKSVTEAKSEEKLSPEISISESLLNKTNISEDAKPQISNEGESQVKILSPDEPSDVATENENLKKMLPSDAEVPGKSLGKVSSCAAEVPEKSLEEVLTSAVSFPKKSLGKVLSSVAAVPAAKVPEKSLETVLSPVAAVPDKSLEIALSSAVKLPKKSLGKVSSVAAVPAAKVPEKSLEKVLSPVAAVPDKSLEIVLSSAVKLPKNDLGKVLTSVAAVPEKSLEMVLSSDVKHPEQSLEKVLSPVAAVPENFLEIASSSVPENSLGKVLTSVAAIPEKSLEMVLPSDVKHPEQSLEKVLSPVAVPEKFLEVASSSVPEHFLGKVLTSVASIPEKSLEMVLSSDVKHSEQSLEKVVSPVATVPEKSLEKMLSKSTAPEISSGTAKPKCTLISMVASTNENSMEEINTSTPKSSLTSKEDKSKLEILPKVNIAKDSSNKKKPKSKGDSIDLKSQKVDISEDSVISKPSGAPDTILKDVISTDKPLEKMLPVVPDATINVVSTEENSKKILDLPTAKPTFSLTSKLEQSEDKLREEIISLQGSLNKTIAESKAASTDTKSQKVKVTEDSSNLKSLGPGGDSKSQTTARPKSPMVDRSDDKSKQEIISLEAERSLKTKPTFKAAAGNGKSQDKIGGDKPNESKYATTTENKSLESKSAPAAEVPNDIEAKQSLISKVVTTGENSKELPSLNTAKPKSSLTSKKEKNDTKSKEEIISLDIIIPEDLPKAVLTEVKLQKAKASKDPKSLESAKEGKPAENKSLVKMLAEAPDPSNTTKPKSTLTYKAKPKSKPSPTCKAEQIEDKSTKFKTALTEETKVTEAAVSSKPPEETNMSKPKSLKSKVEQIEHKSKEELLPPEAKIAEDSLHKAKLETKTNLTEEKSEKSSKSLVPVEKGKSRNKTARESKDILTETQSLEKTLAPVADVPGTTKPKHSLISMVLSTGEYSKKETAIPKSSLTSKVELIEDKSVDEISPKVNIAEESLHKTKVKSQTEEKSPKNKVSKSLESVKESKSQNVILPKDIIPTEKTSDVELPASPDTTKPKGALICNVIPTDEISKAKSTLTSKIEQIEKSQEELLSLEAKISEDSFSKIKPKMMEEANKSKTKASKVEQIEDETKEEKLSLEANIAVGSIHKTKAVSTEEKSHEPKVSVSSKSPEPVGKAKSWIKKLPVEESKNTLTRKKSLEKVLAPVAEVPDITELKQSLISKIQSTEETDLLKTAKPKSSLTSKVKQLEVKSKEKLLIPENTLNKSKPNSKAVPTDIKSRKAKVSEDSISSTLVPIIEVKSQNKILPSEEIKDVLPEKNLTADDSAKPELSLISKIGPMQENLKEEIDLLRAKSKSSLTSKLEPIEDKSKKEILTPEAEDKREPKPKALSTSEKSSIKVSKDSEPVTTSTSPDKKLSAEETKEPTENKPLEKLLTPEVKVPNTIKQKHEENLKEIGSLKTSKLKSTTFKAEEIEDKSKEGKCPEVNFVEDSLNKTKLKSKAVVTTEEKSQKAKVSKDAKSVDCVKEGKSRNIKPSEVSHASPEPEKMLTPVAEVPHNSTKPKFSNIESTEESAKKKIDDVKSSKASPASKIADKSKEEQLSAGTTKPKLSLISKVESTGENAKMKIDILKTDKPSPKSKVEDKSKEEKVSADTSKPKLELIAKVESTEVNAKKIDVLKTAQPSPTPKVEDKSKKEIVPPDTTKPKLMLISTVESAEENAKEKIDILKVTKSMSSPTSKQEILFHEENSADDSLNKAKSKTVLTDKKVKKAKVVSSKSLVLDRGDKSQKDISSEHKAVEKVPDNSSAKPKQKVASTDINTREEMSSLEAVNSKLFSKASKPKCSKPIVDKSPEVDVSEGSQKLIITKIDPKPSISKVMVTEDKVSDIATPKPSSPASTTKLALTDDKPQKEVVSIKTDDKPQKQVVSIEADDESQKEVVSIEAGDLQKNRSSENMPISCITEERLDNLSIKVKDQMQKSVDTPVSKQIQQLLTHNKKFDTQNNQCEHLLVMEAKQSCELPRRKDRKEQAADVTEALDSSQSKYSRSHCKRSADRLDEQTKQSAELTDKKLVDDNTETSGSRQSKSRKRQSKESIETNIDPVAEKVTEKSFDAVIEVSDSRQSKNRRRKPKEPLDKQPNEQLADMGIKPVEQTKLVDDQTKQLLDVDTKILEPKQSKNRGKQTQVVDVVSAISESKQSRNRGRQLKETGGKQIEPTSDSEKTPDVETKQPLDVSTPPRGTPELRRGKNFGKKVETSLDEPTADVIKSSRLRQSRLRSRTKKSLAQDEQLDEQPKVDVKISKRSLIEKSMGTQVLTVQLEKIDVPTMQLKSRQKKNLEVPMEANVGEESEVGELIVDKNVKSDHQHHKISEKTKVAPLEKHVKKSKRIPKNKKNEISQKSEEEVDKKDEFKKENKVVDLVKVGEMSEESVKIEEPSFKIQVESSSAVQSSKEVTTKVIPGKNVDDQKEKFVSKLEQKEDTDSINIVDKSQQIIELLNAKDVQLSKAQIGPKKSVNTEEKQEPSKGSEIIDRESKKHLDELAKPNIEIIPTSSEKLVDHQNKKTKKVKKDRKPINDPEKCEVLEEVCVKQSKSTGVKANSSQEVGTKLSMEIVQKMDLATKLVEPPSNEDKANVPAATEDTFVSLDNSDIFSQSTFIIGNTSELIINDSTEDVSVNNDSAADISIINDSTTNIFVPSKKRKSKLFNRADSDSNNVAIATTKNVFNNNLAFTSTKEVDTRPLIHTSTEIGIKSEVGNNSGVKKCAASKENDTLITNIISTEPSSHTNLEVPSKKKKVIEEVVSSISREILIKSERHLVGEAEKQLPIISPLIVSKDAHIEQKEETGTSEVNQSSEAAIIVMDSESTTTITDIPEVFLNNSKIAEINDEEVKIKNEKEQAEDSLQLLANTALSQQKIICENRSRFKLGYQKIKKPMEGPKTTRGLRKRKGVVEDSSENKRITRSCSKNSRGGKKEEETVLEQNENLKPPQPIEHDSKEPAPQDIQIQISKKNGKPRFSDRLKANCVTKSEENKTKKGRKLKDKLKGKKVNKQFVEFIVDSGSVSVLNECKNLSIKKTCIESNNSNDDSSDSFEGKLIIPDDPAHLECINNTKPMKKSYDVQRKDVSVPIKKMCDMPIQPEPVPAVADAVHKSIVQDVSIPIKKMCDMPIQPEPIPAVADAVHKSIVQDVSNVIDDGKKQTNHRIDYILGNTPCTKPEDSSTKLEVESEDKITFRTKAQLKCYKEPLENQVPSRATRSKSCSWDAQNDSSSSSYRRASTDTKNININNLSYSVTNILKPPTTTTTVDNLGEILEKQIGDSKCSKLNEIIERLESRPLTINCDEDILPKDKFKHSKSALKSPKKHWLNKTEMEVTNRESMIQTNSNTDLEEKSSRVVVLENLLISPKQLKPAEESREPELATVVAEESDATSSKYKKINKVPKFNNTTKEKSSLEEFSATKGLVSIQSNAETKKAVVENTSKIDSSPLIHEDDKNSADFEKLNKSSTIVPTVTADESKSLVMPEAAKNVLPDLPTTNSLDLKKITIDSQTKSSKIKSPKTKLDVPVKSTEVKLGELASPELKTSSMASLKPAKKDDNPEIDKDCQKISTKDVRSTRTSKANKPEINLADPSNTEVSKLDQKNTSQSEDVVSKTSEKLLNQTESTLQPKDTHTKVSDKKSSRSSSRSKDKKIDIDQVTTAEVSKSSESKSVDAKVSLKKSSRSSSRTQDRKVSIEQVAAADTSESKDVETKVTNKLSPRKQENKEPTDFPKSKEAEVKVAEKKIPRSSLPTKDKEVACTEINQLKESEKKKLQKSKDHKEVMDAKIESPSQLTEVIIKVFDKKNNEEVIPACTSENIQTISPQSTEVGISSESKNFENKVYDKKPLRSSSRTKNTKITSTEMAVAKVSEKLEEKTSLESVAVKELSMQVTNTEQSIKPSSKDNKVDCILSKDDAIDCEKSSSELKDKVNKFPTEMNLLETSQSKDSKHDSNQKLLKVTDTSSELKDVKPDSSHKSIVEETADQEASSKTIIKGKDIGVSPFIAVKVKDADTKSKKPQPKVTIQDDMNAPVEIFEKQKTSGKPSKSSRLKDTKICNDQLTPNKSKLVDTKDVKIAEATKIKSKEITSKDDVQKVSTDPSEKPSRSSRSKDIKIEIDQNVSTATKSKPAITKNVGQTELPTSIKSKEVESKSGRSSRSKHNKISNTTEIKPAKEEPEGRRSSSRSSQLDDRRSSSRSSRFEDSKSSSSSRSSRSNVVLDVKDDKIKCKDNVDKRNRSSKSKEIDSRSTSQSKEKVSSVKTLDKYERHISSSNDRNRSKSKRSHRSKSKDHSRNSRSSSIDTNKSSSHDKDKGRSVVTASKSSENVDVTKDTKKKIQTAEAEVKLSKEVQKSELSPKSKDKVHKEEKLSTKPKDRCTKSKPALDEEGGKSANVEVVKVDKEKSEKKDKSEDLGIVKVSNEKLKHDEKVKVESRRLKEIDVQKSNEVKFDAEMVNDGDKKEKDVDTEEAVAVTNKKFKKSAVGSSKEATEVKDVDIIEVGAVAKNLKKSAADGSRDVEVKDVDIIQEKVVAVVKKLKKSAAEGSQNVAEVKVVDVIQEDAVAIKLKKSAAGGIEEAAEVKDMDIIEEEVVVGKKLKKTSVESTNKEAVEVKYVDIIKEEAVADVKKLKKPIVGTTNNEATEVKAVDFIEEEIVAVTKKLKKSAVGSSNNEAAEVREVDIIEEIVSATKLKKSAIVSDNKEAAAIKKSSTTAIKSKDDKSKVSEEIKSSKRKLSEDSEVDKTPKKKPHSEEVKEKSTEAIKSQSECKKLKLEEPKSENEVLNNPKNIEAAIAKSKAEERKTVDFASTSEAKNKPRASELKLKLVSDDSRKLESCIPTVEEGKSSPKLKLDKEVPIKVDSEDVNKIAKSKLITSNPEIHDKTDVTTKSSKVDERKGNRSSKSKFNKDVQIVEAAEKGQDCTTMTIKTETIKCEVQKSSKDIVHKQVQQIAKVEVISNILLTDNMKIDAVNRKTHETPLISEKIVKAIPVINETKVQLVDKIVEVVLPPVLKENLIKGEPTAPRAEKRLSETIPAIDLPTSKQPHIDISKCRESVRSKIEANEGKSKKGVHRAEQRNGIDEIINSLWVSNKISDPTKKKDETICSELIPSIDAIEKSENKEVKSQPEKKTESTGPKKLNSEGTINDPTKLKNEECINSGLTSAAKKISEKPEIIIPCSEIKKNESVVPSKFIIQSAAGGNSMKLKIKNVSIPVKEDKIIDKTQALEVVKMITEDFSDEEEIKTDTLILKPPNVIVEHIPQFHEVAKSSTTVATPMLTPAIPQFPILHSFIEKAPLCGSAETRIPVVSAIIPTPVNLAEVLPAAPTGLDSINNIVDAQIVPSTAGICNQSVGGIPELNVSTESETQQLCKTNFETLDVDETPLSEKVRASGSYQVSNSSSDQTSDFVGDPLLCESISIDTRSTQQEKNSEEPSGDSPGDENAIFPFSEQVCLMENNLTPIESGSLDNSPVDGTSDYQFSQQDNHLGFFIANNLTEDVCLIDPDTRENMFVPNICKEETIEHEEDSVNEFSCQQPNTELSDVFISDNDNQRREDFNQLTMMSIEDMKHFLTSSAIDAQPDLKENFFQQSNDNSCKEETSRESNINMDTEFAIHSLLNLRAASDSLHTFPYANFGLSDMVGLNFIEGVPETTWTQDSMKRTKEPFSSGTIYEMVINKPDAPESNKKDHLETSVLHTPQVVHVGLEENPILEDLILSTLDTKNNEVSKLSKETPKETKKASKRRPKAQHNTVGKVNLVSIQNLKPEQSDDRMTTVKPDQNDDHNPAVRSCRWRNNYKIITPKRKSSELQKQDSDSPTKDSPSKESPPKESQNTIIVVSQNDSMPQFLDFPMPKPKLAPGNSPNRNGRKRRLSLIEAEGKKPKIDVKDDNSKPKKLARVIPTVQPSEMRNCIKQTVTEKIIDKTEKSKIVEDDDDDDFLPDSKSKKPAPIPTAEQLSDMFDSVKKMDVKRLSIPNSSTTPKNKETAKRYKPNIIDPEEVSTNFEKEIKNSKSKMEPKAPDWRCNAAGEQAATSSSLRKQPPDAPRISKSAPYPNTSDSYKQYVEPLNNRGHTTIPINSRRSSNPDGRHRRQYNGNSRPPSHPQSSAVDTKYRHHSDNNTNNRVHSSGYYSSSNNHHPYNDQSIRRPHERNRRDSYLDTHHSSQKEVTLLSNSCLGNPRTTSHKQNYAADSSTAWMASVAPMLPQSNVSFTPSKTSSKGNGRN